MFRRIKRRIWPTYYLVRTLRWEMHTLFNSLRRFIMSLAEEFNAKLDAINVATNTLATVVADIRNQLSNPNMTPAEKEALLTRMAGVETALQAIAADPNNPVPEPEPQPVGKSTK